MSDRERHAATLAECPRCGLHSPAGPEGADQRCIWCGDTFETNSTEYAIPADGARGYALLTTEAWVCDDMRWEVE